MKHLFKGTKWDVPCERCGVRLSECKCPPPPPPAPVEEKKPEPARRPVVRVEKRPKGKKVTVLSGLPEAELESLAPRLRALCGAGGTVKDGHLEIQGDHKDRVARELARSGLEPRVS